MSAPLSVAIVGSNGRMGRRLNALIDADPLMRVGALIDADGLCLSEVDGASIDVVIDFSVAEQVDTTLAWCRRHATPLVLGTTGLSDAQWGEVDAIATEVHAVLGL